MEHKDPAAASGDGASGGGAREVDWETHGEEGGGGAGGLKEVREEWGVYIRTVKMGGQERAWETNKPPMLRRLAKPESWRWRTLETEDRLRSVPDLGRRC